MTDTRRTLYALREELASLASAIYQSAPRAQYVAASVM